MTEWLVNLTGGQMDMTGIKGMGGTEEPESSDAFLQLFEEVFSRLENPSLPSEAVPVQSSASSFLEAPTEKGWKKEVDAAGSVKESGQVVAASPLFSQSIDEKPNENENINVNKKEQKEQKSMEGDWNDTQWANTLTKIAVHLKSDWKTQMQELKAGISTQVQAEKRNREQAENIHLPTIPTIQIELRQKSSPLKDLSLQTLSLAEEGHEPKRINESTRETTVMAEAVKEVVKMEQTEKSLQIQKSFSLVQQNETSEKTTAEPQEANHPDTRDNESDAWHQEEEEPEEHRLLVQQTTGKSYGLGSVGGDGTKSNPITGFSESVSMGKTTEPATHYGMDEVGTSENKIAELKETVSSYLERFLSVQKFDHTKLHFGILTKDFGRLEFEIKQLDDVIAVKIKQEQALDRVELENIMEGLQEEWEGKGKEIEIDYYEEKQHEEKEEDEKNRNKKNEEYLEFLKKEKEKENTFKLVL